MKVKCFYNDQEAHLIGVDMNKKMYKVEAQDKKLHYVNELNQLTFPDDQVEMQTELFKSA